MKILVVSSDYLPNVSGVATITHEQSMGLASLGHEIRILTSTKGLVDQEDPYGLSVLRIYTPSNWITRFFNWNRVLFRESLSWNPDFIWCTTYRGFGLPAMQVARQLKIPYGIYFHGTELLTENRFLRRNLLCCVARNARFVATNSQNSQRLLMKNFGITSEVITPGVFQPPITHTESVSTMRTLWLSELQSDLTESDAFVFICACRIVRSKGIDNAIEAISRLPERLRNRCVYLIAGEGEDMDFLRALSRKVDLGKQVYFTGPLDHDVLFQFLAAADCYLQPSQPRDGFLESFGISYLEAQASGLPCIATRFGGIPEAVRDNVTGILVEPGSVSELVDALTFAMDSIEWRQKAGIAAKEWANANLWTEHLRKLNALLTS